MTPKEWREYTEQTLVTVHDLLNNMTGLTEAIESSEAIVSLIDQWMDDRAKQEIRELPPITAAAPPSLTAQTQAEAKAPALPFKPIRETVGWQQLWRQATEIYRLGAERALLEDKNQELQARLDSALSTGWLDDRGCRQC